MIQVWPLSDTADQAAYSETVSVCWDPGVSDLSTVTTLYSMPTNTVGGFCWYGYIAQLSSPTRADVLYIDPGHTPLQTPRVGGPTYTSVTIRDDDGNPVHNWIKAGGHIVLCANRVVFPAPPAVVFKTIVKIWTIT